MANEKLHKVNVHDLKDQQQLNENISERQVYCMVLHDRTQKLFAVMNEKVNMGNLNDQLKQSTETKQTKIFQRTKTRDKTTIITPEDKQMMAKKCI